MPFYLLINALFEEAKLSQIDRNLVREELLSERNHPVYAEVNEKLFGLRDAFNNGELTAAELLKKSAKIYAPKSL